jgi:hypothetical protein
MRAGFGSLFYARLIEEGLKLKSELLKPVRDTLNLVFHENLNLFYFLARCNAGTMFQIAQEICFLTVQTCKSPVSSWRYQSIIGANVALWV